MTNAELIKALRICSSQPCCDNCPRYDIDHAQETNDCCVHLLEDAADALEAAEQRIAELESQLPKEGEWISVEDRLPEDGKTVLCAIYHTDLIVAHEGESFEEAIRRCQAEAAEHPYMTLGFYRESEGWSENVFGAPMVCAPSYWLEIPPMPLPDAPEVEG